jgi:hypothetical protein
MAAARRGLTLARAQVTVGVMTAARMLVMSLGLLACGSPAADTPSKPDESPVQLGQPEAQLPKHDPKMLGGGGEEAVHTVAAQGSMGALLNGVATSFTFLPFGSNVAAWSDKTSVARVALAGAPTDRGMPMLRVVLENVRLDQLKLPASFTIGGGDGKAGGPRPRIEYLLEQRKSWLAEPDGAAIGTITIESFAGKRVRGSFHATLTPRSTAFGPPIELTEGVFDIELRLQGIEPAASAPVP